MDENLKKEDEKPPKNRELDRTDRDILNILSQNARTKLTQISKKIGLSVDSIKKRIMKLERSGIITKYTIQVNTGIIGLPLGVHIYVKFKNFNQSRFEEFIKYLRASPRVIDLMSMAGDYDLYIVILAAGTEDIEKKKNEIRQNFSDIIGDWKEVLVTRLHKLEEYKF
ncbi:MAG: Lrp/AsnC family transcriptional regulator [Candidatus Aenigmarchaeota archaeon]|nr:Lrp/AsnC family transcriptional regulator [Candidatus Aenigmarchaeota archaeon]